MVINTQYNEFTATGQFFLYAIHTLGLACLTFELWANGEILSPSLSAFSDLCREKILNIHSELENMKAQLFLAVETLAFAPATPFMDIFLNPFFSWFCNYSGCCQGALSHIQPRVAWNKANLTSQGMARSLSQSLGYKVTLASFTQSSLPSETKVQPSYMSSAMILLR